MHIFISNETFFGKGYAEEMLNLFMDIAKNQLGLIKIWLKVNDDNTGAINFYNKMGFIKEGFLRKHEFYKGEFLNKIIYSRFLG